MLLLFSSYGVSVIVVVPVEVGGPIYAESPTSEFAGVADVDDLNTAINNNPFITFHDGSHLIFHDASNVVFHDPFGNPSAPQSVAVPRGEYTGEADL